MTKLIRRTVLLVAVLLLASSGVAHAQYVPGQPGFILDPDTLPQTGGTTTIRGVGCPPDTTVNAFIVVDGSEVPLGSGRTGPDIDGLFDFEVQVPPLAPGEYTVLVRCGPVTLSNILTITPVAQPVVPAPVTPLPRTGADALDLLRWALLLVAVGGLLAVGAKRRRGTQAASAA